ncbi:MAG TPA: MMPL family transporter [Ktedonobacteraceae bacterium]
MQIQDRPGESPASGAPAAVRALETHALYRLGLAYGRQVFRLRWFIIAFWVIVLGASIPFTAKVGDALNGGGYSYDASESSRVDTIISTKLPRPASQLLVVFQSDHTATSDPAYQQEVNAFVSRVRTYHYTTGVSSSGGGLDGHTIYVTVNLSIYPNGDQLSAFRTLVPQGSAATPAHTYVTGDPAVDHEFSSLSTSDVARAEFTALPIALVVLFMILGTLVAAAMPLLLAMLSVPVSLALIYAIGLHISMSIFVLNVASIIGLGISIDYSLFMVRRFRDELAEGRSVAEAVGWTIATSGEAILFSGLIVMIGFAGLLLIRTGLTTSLGIGGAVVVAVSVLAALTLLPALLSVLGPRINALRIPIISRLTAPLAHAARENGSKPRRNFWESVAESVMKRPLIFIVAVTAVLVALGWPIFSIELGTPGVTSLPASSESRQGIDILNKQFPDTNTNIISIIAQAPRGSSMLSSDNLAKLDNLSRWLAAQPHITNVISLTRLPATNGAPAPTVQELTALYTTGAYRQNPAIAQLVTSTTNGNITLITATTDAQLDSSQGNALIDDLRAGDKAAGQGLTVLVGGQQANDLDFDRYLYGNFPLSILFILGSTYVLLLLMFRSLFLPLKAILMNVLSVGACLGVLVFVFQWGHLSNVLNFTANGYLDSITPILLFCILFGLSMDYEVFLLSRVQEEWLRTHNNRYAVARGLEKTGGVITNAALLFVIVTGAFTFTSILTTKEIGLGMSLAVLVDATIIRTLLVPATMRLLGRWNWWLPGRKLPPRQSE